MIFKLFKLLFVVAILVLVIQKWLQKKSYLFSHEAVHKIAKNYANPKDLQIAFSKIHSEFQQKYPGHILDRKDLNWVYINSGGWMGSVCLLHASLTEYVLFFGTPIDFQGHSGRYWANISQTIIHGTIEEWRLPSLNKHTYKPGAYLMHSSGQAGATAYRNELWLVEYGRGFIPSTLPFFLSDTIFSTHDYYSLYSHLLVYFKAFSLEMSVYFHDFLNFLGV